MNPGNSHESHDPPAGALIAVLAAGKGQRFGQAKQAALLAGRPLVSWAVGAALASGAERVLVVTGFHAADTAAALPPDPRLELLSNPQPGRGMGSSLALAAERALALEAPVMAVLLGDMPLVRPETVRQVLAAALAAPAGAAAAQVAGRPVHPVAFVRKHLEALGRLQGETGGRELLQELAWGLALVPAPAYSALDVDRPQALAAAAATLAAQEEDGQA